MRIARLAGRSVLLTDEGAVDLPAPPADDVFAHWDDLLAWSATATGARPYAEADLETPVPAPRQIFAVALNYRPHAAEAGYEEPAAPLVFTKFPTCLTGPYTTVDLPAGHVDWELELVAVIGREARRVPVEKGWDPVVALTVGQDLSERISQLAGRPAQFSLGKSYPGFGPVGPALVGLDEFPDRDDLELTCVLNGETVQHDRTANMIFPIPRLVSYLSEFCTLLPGDLIFTGTPAGVGNRRVPQRFLTPGDELVSRIEGVGEMRHRFRRNTP
ncbi:fumarylacetoacetate hydrolase family protein [Streptomyces sp. NBC_01275]|uniref:fumarylacetoacetate hydrolase family protein n=1 Tax=Streptomyces sp. NBC_01275 TaxID=2903807 RepID=UPI00225C1639|nr:fumarylacetoacetate hydrolase family protein [Streptomyces sp. NBC_01275]MCX4765152.1 fumarylacetoacetate hydrolase family protein [Streptomyces sp. NBC_01275]